MCWPPTFLTCKSMLSAGHLPVQVLQISKLPFQTCPTFVTSVFETRRTSWPAFPQKNQKVWSTPWLSIGYADCWTRARRMLWRKTVSSMCPSQYLWMGIGMGKFQQMWCFKRKYASTARRPSLSPRSAVLLALGTSTIMVSKSTGRIMVCFSRRFRTQDCSSRLSGQSVKEATCSVGFTAASSALCWRTQTPSLNRAFTCKWTSFNANRWERKRSLSRCRKSSRSRLSRS
mmetsp:Transcript_135081/g.269552  ORF Transcript_135081/g.269552 Transcript_135081/m.269552 type:complete len:230 (-) Transcript_135081:24-713(-)